MQYLINMHIFGKQQNTLCTKSTICKPIMILSCLFNAGISCPRASRPMDGKMVPAEPFGQEAHLFTKELVLQREVDVEVEACDKGGNFIGWLFVDDKNLAVTLVEVCVRACACVCVCVRACVCVCVCVCQWLGLW